MNIKCLKWKKKISWLKKITYIQRWSKETKPIRGVWQFNFNTCISIRGLLEKFVDKVIYGKITVYRMKYVLWTDYQMKKKKVCKKSHEFFHTLFFFSKRLSDFYFAWFRLRTCLRTNNPHVYIFIYIYISTEGCVYYIFQCMLEFICQICIEPRIGNC